MHQICSTANFFNGLRQRRFGLLIAFVPWITSLASEPKKRAPMLLAIPAGEWTYFIVHNLHFPDDSGV